MPVGFLELPGELRNHIYKLVLAQHELIEPIRCWKGDCGACEKLDTGLLYANKSIHREASWIFYSQNCFSFSRHDYACLNDFVSLIGSSNLNEIRHICVDLAGSKGHDNDWFGQLAKGKHLLINLRTLTFTPPTWFSKIEAAIGYDVVMGKLVDQIDICLKDITSLEHIIFKMYEEEAYSDFGREIQGRGWTIKIKHFVLYDEMGEYEDYEDYEGHEAYSAYGTYEESEEDEESEGYEMSELDEVTAEEEGSQKGEDFDDQAPDDVSNSDDNDH